MKNIAIQCLLRPALTVVDRCLDYDNFRATIERIDRLLIDSEVESQSVDLALERGQPMSVKARQKRANFALKALRMETLRYLLGGISFRHLSRALGSSDLLADFLSCPPYRRHKGHLQEHPWNGPRSFSAKSS